LTHTLLGAALARAGLGRRSPLSTPALLVAANLPDLDIVVNLWGGRPAYLLNHRGVTHSVPGLVVESLLLAGLVAWIERRRARRHGESPPPRLAVLPAVAAGLFSHLLLDALNNYGVRPWLPFSSARYYADLVHIIDPVQWVIYGGVALLARPGRVRPVLAAAAVLLALHFGGRAVARELAFERADAELAAVLPPHAVVRERVPRPAMLNPLRWTVIAATDSDVWRVPVDLLRGAGPVDRFPRGLDDPCVKVAESRPIAKAWRSFARVPMAAVTRLPGGRVRVDLMDGRYGLLPGADWPSLPVVLSAAECESLAPGG
jgi:inner membrane protein